LLIIIWFASQVLSFFFPPLFSQSAISIDPSPTQTKGKKKETLEASQNKSFYVKMQRLPFVTIFGLN
jgi:hypothetical protein